MCQDAVFPSLTDSTVVLATPAKSPPQNTPGTLVSMVSLLTSAVPHLVILMGSNALITKKYEIQQPTYSSEKINKLKKMGLGIGFE